MPEDTIYDPNDKGTLRPNEDSLRKTGDTFKPMQLPDWDYQITFPENVSPDDPISLFDMYYTPEIINLIVQKMNEHLREPKDDSPPYFRANAWYPTCAGEIYIYFAIRIYMTLHVENEISDYWKTFKNGPVHPIREYMSRNRFQELHMRVRAYGDEAKGPYEKVNALSTHFQTVNCNVWKPGRDLAIDEMIVRFEGRSKQTTTVPNKPTPTGYNVWGVAQRGFLLCWNWHIPGVKNGPVGVRTPSELSGTKKAGKGGNRTQAVVLHLLKRLPTPLEGSGYHVFLDNLFFSTKFVQYARSQGITITGTCRTNAGIFQELLDLYKIDKKDVIPWGETHSFYTPNGEVCQVGWKDQAFVLMISSFMSGDKRVDTLRKKPKESSSKVKTARAPFGNEATEVLSIPAIANSYNYNMGAVDEFDHLAAQNAGLRHVERGGHQALEHWLLRTVLINSYLLALCSDIPGPRAVSFRSQTGFRDRLISTLLARGKTSDICPKRRISQVSQEADLVAPQLHERVKMAKKNWCVACKGLRCHEHARDQASLA